MAKVTVFAREVRAARRTVAMGVIGRPDGLCRHLGELSAAGFGNIFMQTLRTMNLSEADLAGFKKMIGPVIAALL